MVSGLGFAICKRLIDEFLETYPSSNRLTLIITTRSQQKSDDTTRRLRKHLSNIDWREGQKPGTEVSYTAQQRVKLQAEQLDLLSLLSVKRLARKLTDDADMDKWTGGVDVLIFNAGIGGWTGLNWPKAIWHVLTDMRHAVTFPPFKNSGVGWATKQQFPSRQIGTEEKQVHPVSSEEPVLGEVFTANLFGHYMLGHWLSPLLARSKRGARLIWLSSLEAYASTLNMGDFQGMKSLAVYECTKRITDVMVLTSGLESTTRFTKDYFDTAAASTDLGVANPSSVDTATSDYNPPRHLLSHPGICATSIMGLPFILELAMTAAFYLARWLGSPWHCVSPYLAAVAPVWLALSPTAALDTAESDEQGRSRKSKWGSAVNIRGAERVVRTETEGWGWAGQIGESQEWRSGMKSKGRWRYATDLTVEDRQRFEEAGWEVWGELERLRREWEGLIHQYEASVEK